MEFLRSLLRRLLAGRPVVASPNVSCFLRLVSFLIHSLKTVEKRVIKPMELTSSLAGRGEGNSHHVR